MQNHLPYKNRFTSIQESTLNVKDVEDYTVAYDLQGKQKLHLEI